MDEKVLRTEVQKLIDKFERVKAQGKYKSYNEENTKKDFILPLFRALGWNVDDSEEVKAEEKVSKKRVDYAFRINGVVKFYLEAKPLREYLTEPKYAKQAIEYAWNKSITWAILCNFEGIRVFNAEWKWDEKRPMRNSFLDLRYTDFLDSSFEYLTWLSRESFEQGILDKKASDLVKKTKKLPIDKQLLADFTEYRSILTKDVLKHNQSKNLSQDDLDEIVQRILNRLIFIRTCEDKEIESEKLESLVRMYSETEGKLYKELNKKFREYDDGYNSKLFREHLCEDVIISNDALGQVILGTYQTKDLSITYDFSAIGADVLGNIYEQYLGHILKKTTQRAKLTSGQAHRKEQGIYYTPTYIVNYIVRNTVGEKLKQRKVKLDELKILDPACGSGSFLLKAFDVICEHEIKKEGKTLQTKFEDVSSGKLLKRKTELLKNCIFGVDLDSQAVEIAQLTLLLKLAEKRHRLPTLQENIKCGNSLIDDSAVAGDRAFRWEEQFKEIMKDGGFDVVIGNPPYVRIQTLNKDEVEYYNNKYKSPTKNYDIYILFIEKGFSLLKENGVLGLILPHKFFQGEMGENIRKYIYETKSLYKLVDFTTNQIFESATTYTCLLFLSKRKNKHFYYKRFELGDNFKDLQNIDFEKKDIEILKANKWNFSSDIIQRTLSKIVSQKNSFEDITKKIFKGSSTGNDEIFLLDPIKENKNTFLVFSKKLNQNIEIEKSLLRPFVYGEDIHRYASLESKKLLLFPYVFKNNKIQLIPVEEMKREYPLAYEYFNKTKGDLLKRKIETNNNNFYKYSAARSLSDYNQPKIMIPDMLVSNRISYDETGIIYHGPAIHSIVFNERIKGQNPIFYIAILNSKLFWFFISNTSTALRGNAYRLTPEFLNPFCFPTFDLSKHGERQMHDGLVLLVNKMFSFNKRLGEIGDKKTDELARIEDEIKKTDNEIDTLVYKLYGLTKEEIAIVEESLKE